jgi:hypothetical protein
MELNKNQPTMNYSMIIKRVELESANLNELVEIAVSEGCCPSTEIFANGKLMQESLADFISY